MVEAPALQGGMLDKRRLLLCRRELWLSRGQGCFCIPSLGTTEGHQEAQPVFQVIVGLGYTGTGEILG